MEGSGDNLRFCKDCMIRFAVHTRRKKRKYFCPFCGDTIAVEKFDKDKHGERKRPPRRDWTTLERKKLREMRAQNRDSVEIANALNRSTIAIRKMADILGCSFEVRNAWKPQEDEILKKWLDTGLKPAEIANMCVIERNRIQICYRAEYLGYSFKGVKS